MAPGIGGNPSSGRTLSGFVTSIGTFRSAAFSSTLFNTRKYSSSSIFFETGFPSPLLIVNVPRAMIKSASSIGANVQPLDST